MSSPTLPTDFARTGFAPGDAFGLDTRPMPLDTQIARPMPAQAWTASLIAHEIRAPIGALRSLVELIDLHWHAQIPPGAQPLWHALQTETENLHTMAESLLDLATAQFAAPVLAPVDLDRLVGEIAARLGKDYPLARISIEPLGVVEADEQLLACLWRNLVGNALKYSQRAESPRVRIKPRGNGRHGYREFSVVDNGIGIPEPMLERVFEPFNRATGAREFEGHGLGLPAVRAIARAHGGNAWVARSSPVARPPAEPVRAARPPWGGPGLAGEVLAGTEVCFSLRHSARRELA